MSASGFIHRRSRYKILIIFYQSALYVINLIGSKIFAIPQVKRCSFYERFRFCRAPHHWTSGMSQDHLKIRTKKSRTEDLPSATDRVRNGERERERARERSCSYDQRILALVFLP